MSDDTADGGSVPATNAGYDEWLDAVADGEGYALVCPDGHGSLPPRRVCPECGSTELSREPLAATGTVETQSVVHVPSPRFAEDAPYVTAIADFGPVRVTGVVRGIDPEPDAIEAGDELEASVGTRETDGERIVVFRPTDEA
ncbi:nucleic acid-binding protein [Halorubrum sp. SD626R]|uniref:Zn-ribbon domain-containing OB-fold protein n=1 Tax=Halorubrum TaxID=56688 RepID=UPI0010F52C21|nr:MULTISPECIES: OB-fold domain-containing protein [Halorubrum]TKX76867.1 nucleic acid-binding protein [Halorubrum sp. SD626R]